MIKVQYAQSPGETCPLQPGKSYQAYLWAMTGEEVFVSRTGQSFSIPQPSVVPNTIVMGESEDSKLTIRFDHKKEDSHEVPEHENHVGFLLIKSKQECVLQDIRGSLEAWIQERLEHTFEKTLHESKITDDITGTLVWDQELEIPSDELDPESHYYGYAISFCIPKNGRKANMVFMKATDVPTYKPPSP